MDIPTKVRHIPHQRIVYDAPFKGAHDTNLSRQTAAYVARCVGSTSHYHFPYSIAAPRLTIAAGNTWTSFTHHGATGSCDFDVAWFHQDQMSAIRAIVRVITPSRAQCMVRVHSDDLVDAVAQTTGDGVKSVAMHTSGFHYWNSKHWIDSNWEVRGRAWRVSSHVCYLESPTLPANRRVALTPQIKIPTDADVLIGVNGDPTYYLQDMYVEDIYSIDEGS